LKYRSVYPYNGCIIYNKSKLVAGRDSCGDKRSGIVRKVFGVQGIQVILTKQFFVYAGK
jgi:hypothetical protein